MHKFNGLSSPMYPLEEDLNDTETIRLKKIEFIKLRELSKSPHCIGSVNDIETKVYQLEEQIKNVQSNCEWCCSDSDEEDSNFQTRESAYNQREKREVAQFAGVFSVVSNYAFNKPDRIKKIAKMSMNTNKEAKKNTEEKALPKFIELCEHPGFDISIYTELPGSVHADFILTRVYKAQPSTFVTNFRKFFEKWFLSEWIQKILKDIFWFFYIAKYGSDSDKNDLSNYFSRTASNYVNFLFQISKESLYHQEKFKKKLPNLLSQALYAALSECFPDSWIQYDADFIERIIILIHFWFAGIRCTKGIWQHWNMQELKPTEQKQREKVIEEQSRMGLVDLESDKNVDDHVSFDKKKTVESTVVGPLNQSRCVLLNVNGQSPLVQYHLQKKFVNTSAGLNTAIKHKEINQIKTGEDSLTYSDIVNKSLTDQKGRVANFRRSNARNEREMKMYLKTQQLANQNNERKQEKLLTNKKAVHNLSNIMVHEYLKDKDSISFNSDAIVRDTIAAIE